MPFYVKITKTMGNEKENKRCAECLEENIFCKAKFLFEISAKNNYETAQATDIEDLKNKAESSFTRQAIIRFLATQYGCPKDLVL